MENTVIIVDTNTATDIKIASLFDNSPFKEVTILKMSNDKYYINFNKFLSNTSLFLCGIYLSEVRNYANHNFIEFEDLNNND